MSEVKHLLGEPPGVYESERELRRCGSPLSNLSTPTHSLFLELGVMFQSL